MSAIFETQEFHTMYYRTMDKYIQERFLFVFEGGLLSQNHAGSRIIIRIPFNPPENG
jgi:hypothetical protein